MPLDVAKCPQCGEVLPPEVLRGAAPCARCGQTARGGTLAPPPSDLSQTLISRPPGPMGGARGPRARDGGPGSRYRRRLAGGTSGPPRVRVAIERGKAPITLPPGKVGGVFRRRAFERDVEKLRSFAWTDEEIVELAGRMLGAHADLAFAPEISEARAAAVHATYAGRMTPDDRVLVVFSDTLFGAEDDGFALTARGIFWKNLAEEPDAAGWDQIDPSCVSYDETDQRISLADGDLHLTHADAEVIAPRLCDLIVCLASLAQDEAE